MNQTVKENKSNDVDVLYSQVVDFVNEQRKVSTSLIQRKFSIGYNRSARIIQDLEDNGVVSPTSATGGRIVLISGNVTEKTEADEMMEKEQNRVDTKKAESPELPIDQEVTADAQGVSGQRIKSFIERVERLEEEKKSIAEDIKEVYAEAKTSGFDSKIIRKIVSLRKVKVEQRREDGELLDLYMVAIGMAE